MYSVVFTVHTTIVSRNNNNNLKKPSGIVHMTHEFLVNFVASSPLHRGYHTDAIPEDKPPEISHLVFVVHGIGQLLHLSNIVKSCSE